MPILPGQKVILKADNENMHRFFPSHYSVYVCSCIYDLCLRLGN